MFDSFLQSLWDNWEWLFSGVAVTLISIVANVVTSAVARRTRTKITIKMSDGDGKVHHIHISSDETEEHIEEAIKKIRGDIYKDPTAKLKS